MLSKSIYTGEYIQELYERTGNDPALLERAIYAFGLLEAIKKVLKSLTNNPEFQSLDANVKNKLNLKVNRARGI